MKNFWCLLDLHVFLFHLIPNMVHFILKSGSCGAKRILTGFTDSSGKRGTEKTHDESTLNVITILRNTIVEYR